MTTEGFRGVDDDLLADYLGGALDGTPQQEEVARLVATDPAWAEAHALLAPALAEVRAELTRWAEPSPQMPQAIADRLGAALVELGPMVADTSTDEDTAATADADRPATSPVVPMQGGARRRPAGPAPAGSGRSSTGPGRRAGWIRRGAPVAAAAIAVVAVALGLNQLSMRAGDDTAGTSAMERPANAPAGAAAPAAARTTGPALRSGTNYTPQTLGNAVDVDGETLASPGRATGDAAGSPPELGTGERRPSPDGSDQLARLTTDAALSTCLADVAAEHGSAPLTVEMIDYARFQGEQALVIRFTDATGSRWAWVSGPECGVPGSGSDSRYSARVG
ncbi:hypothetical protein AB0B85_25115 [Micromonospora sp. NPDC049044]|uniref:hypothetical protein n=1 Tax=unclassified Micromonospora TaxID=2617518 RepID=UPI0033C8A1A4